jgi:hypothetical protein
MIWLLFEYFQLWDALQPYNVRVPSRRELVFAEWWRNASRRTCSQRQLAENTAMPAYVFDGARPCTSYYHCGTKQVGPRFG